MGWTCSCSRKTLQCGTVPSGSLLITIISMLRGNCSPLGFMLYLAPTKKEDQGCFKVIWTSCLPSYWSHRKDKGLWGWKFALPSLEIRKPILQCVSWGQGSTGCTAADSLAPATTGWLLFSWAPRQEKCDLDTHLESPSSIYWKTQRLTLVKDCCTFHRRAQYLSESICCLNAAKLPLLRAHPDWLETENHEQQTLNSWEENSSSESCVGRWLENKREIFHCLPDAHMLFSTCHLAMQNRRVGRERCLREGCVLCQGSFFSRASERIINTCWAP